MDLTAFRDRLERAVAAREIPGAVAVHGDRDTAEVFFAGGVERFGSGDDRGDPVGPGTVYDLASLTKVTATLPALLSLVQAGEVTLDDRLGRFFAQAGWFQQPSLADATLRDLLSHSSGLPAWRPLFAWVSERRTAVANVLSSALEHPVGRVVYSDLGFIALGAVVERVTGDRLDRVAERAVYAPLGMDGAEFRPPRETPAETTGIAATEDCGWRGRLLRGEVHDENAWTMDGVAGHAGLFGTARDLARYAQAWLRLETPFAPPELLREATREQARNDEQRRGLGWQLYEGGAYGHTGFTGTSLWLDPVRGRFGVLLTNRVHPHRERGGVIVELRRGFHEALARA